MSIYARPNTSGRKIYWFRIWINGREFSRSTKQSNRA